MQNIFISQSNGTNPVEILLDSDINFHKLTMTAFSLDGVPVTAGVPNYLYYNLHFEGISHSGDYLRNDNHRGIPLQLTGPFTCEHFHGGVVLTKTETSPARQFKIRLTKPDGSDATFSRLAIWLENF